MTCTTLRAGCRLLLALSFALGLSVGPLSSLASALQLTPQQKTEMKAHYDKATRAYDVGKYSEAVEEYQKAYEIGGDPAMLYNIGQAHRLGDQPAEAVRFYRRYLQRSPNARNRDDVERRIVDLERLAEARRLAQPVTPVPPAAPTPAPGMPAPQAVAPPPVAALPSPTSSGFAEDGTPGRGRRIAAYVLLATGVVAAGVSAYYGNLAGEKADRLTADSKKSPPVEFNPVVERNGQRAQLVAVLSGIGGAAALVASGVLFLTGSSASDDVETAPRSGGATVVPVMGGGVLGAGAVWSF